MKHGDLTTDQNDLTPASPWAEKPTGLQGLGGGLSGLSGGVLGGIFPRPCPSCGTCPTCGARQAPHWPYGQPGVTWGGIPGSIPMGAVGGTVHW